MLIRVPSVQIVQIVPNVLNGLNRLNVLNPTHRKITLDRYCVVFRHSMNPSLAVAVNTGDVTAAVRSSLRFAREGDVMLKKTHG